MKTPEGPDYSRPPHGYDESKTTESKSGFKVLWLNASEVSVGRPGIYIRFCRPDGDIKEQAFFPFSQETEAQEQFNEYVKKLRSWGEID